MKKLFLFLIVLLLSVWAGAVIKKDPGYVLLAYHTWTVEMPLWFAIVSILVAFLVLYGFLRLLHSPSGLLHRWRAFMIRRRLRRANNLTSRGVLELVEEHWSVAEQDLMHAVSNSHTPLVNYLAAARAAQAQEAYTRRDDYLRLAKSAVPDADVAVGLMQAKWQMAQGEFERARHALEQLHHDKPHNVSVLRALKNVYLKLEDWQALADLLPALKKYKVLSADEFLSLQMQVNAQSLQYVIDHQPTAADDFWRRLPRKERTQSAVLHVYIPALIKAEHVSTAEEMIRDAIKHNWDEKLVYLYGTFSAPDMNKQLTTAESWLKAHREDGILLLTLGRLCLHLQLWGKARNYFEMSLQRRPHAETYCELAKLLEQLGETQAAADLYRKAALFAAR